MFEHLDDILTVEDVSETLKIGITQAYRIIHSGQLKCYKEGRDWKIPKASLVKYIKMKTGLIE